MKYLVKIAGLCLASVLVMGMAITATASAAAPVWEQCSTGGSATKYSTSQCTTASGTGVWQWNEISTTSGAETIRIKGSLLLKDTKEPGEPSIECSGEGVGTVGPGKAGKIGEIKTSPAQCRQVSVCENVEEAEARNTPWTTELFAEGGKQLEKIVSGTGGPAGWKIKCKVPILGKVTDECLAVEGEPESLELINKATGGELLVLATFQGLRKAKCSLGGAGAGLVTGSLSILKENGRGLRVS